MLGKALPLAAALVLAGVGASRAADAPAPHFATTDEATMAAGYAAAAAACDQIHAAPSNPTVAKETLLLLGKAVAAAGVDPKACLPANDTAQK